jgi:membrane protein YdbS with pleckstrin-like domain
MMSIRAPRLNFRLPRRKNTAAAQPDDLWRTRRSRWGIKNFHRGRDKQWHFSGQQPDETVKMLVRKHPLFLLKAALPLLGSIAFLLVATALMADASLSAFHPLWVGLEIVASILVLIAFAWFAYKDFVVWWLETYIITNKRIIGSRGLLQPKRQETPIEKVIQVDLHMEPLGIMLSFGTVHVYLVGGDFKLEDVPNPRKVKDAIQGISDEIKAKKPSEEPPVPEDPKLATVLGTLAQKKEVPKLPDADAHYPPLPPGEPRRPRRTFGGILRIPCEVHYSPGEYSVMYLQRSRYVLYRNLALPVLLLVIILFAGFSSPVLLPLISIFALVLLILIGLIYTNYADDVFILSTRRIIDIERRLIIFYEARTETEYKNVRDTRVDVANILRRLLDIGNLFIETPGSTPNIVFSNIDHPFDIQDKLQEIMTYKEKADEAEKENKSRKELNKWFSTIVTVLEEKVQNVGVPNLQNLDFWSAVDVASEFGLRVVVMGEEAVNSGHAPGVVIQQSPPPGTLSNGGEIQVLLSRS